jgi:hypothetical protein
LSTAIQKLYEPGVFEKLRANLPTSHAEKDWQQYVKVITRTK